MSKVKLNLKNLSVPQKVQFAKQIVTSMTGNANFASPLPALTSITAANKELEDAFNAAKKPLEKTLKQLAVVVMVLIISIPVKGQWGTNGNHIYYNTGNVGIGTPSPSYKLDIVGLIGEVGLRVGDDGTKVFRMLWDNSVDEGVIDSWYGSALHPIRISGSVIKLTGGNVGIGTMDPEAKLHVAGGDVMISKASGSPILNVGRNKSTDRIRLLWYEPENRGVIDAWESVAGHRSIRISANPLYLSGGEVHIMGGNVGIGTTTPSQKLTVNGKILAEEVQVVLNVPDYVFAKEYKLKTLSEVSKFINEHKHLPEVPSEKEVLDNCGQVSLGEMNMTLLKKIEELTLYAIEQENNIKEQKENIKEQKDNSQKQDEVIKASLKRVTEQDDLIKSLLKRVTELEKQ